MSAAAKKVEAAAKSLPEGWRWAPLADLVNPNRPKIKPADRPELPFIGMEHIESNTMTLLGTVPASTMKSNAVHFQSGDVLYGRLRPYLNKVFRPTFEGLCSAEFIVMPENDEINGKYLQYFLNSSAFVFFASHLKEGDRPRVDFKILSPYEVPLPPTKDDQARIVAEIEKQFSRLDEAVASLKRVKASLKRYKAAILKAAVEGKLTEEWRKQNPDVEPASKLLERFAPDDKQDGSSIDTQPRQFDSALPDSWAYVPLGQLIEYTTSGSRGWAKYYSEDGDIFIRAQNINRDVLDMSDVAFVSLPEKAEGKRTRVKLGDLLITITGANVTKSALIDTEIDGSAYISQHVALVRPLSSKFSEYIYLFIVSPSHGRRQLEKAAYGAGKPGLNLTNIRELGVAFPPLLEQEEIVLAVDAVLSKIDSIEVAIVKQESRISAARASILKQAFSGVSSIIEDAA